MLLRKFNTAGIAEFRDYLHQLRQGRTIESPAKLCHADGFSEAAKPGVEVDELTFSSKLEAAQYLADRVKSVENGLYDPGLWTWLSAFYFDSVCPIQSDERKPGEDYRHVLEPGRNWKHFYRHLLAGPTRTFSFHGMDARLLLSGPVHKLGDFVEQLASRQEIVVNNSLIKLVDQLYWKDGPKRGAASNKKKPGTLRRFVDIIRQLEMTYDLNSMQPWEIAALLPAEFDTWLGRQ